MTARPTREASVWEQCQAIRSERRRQVDFLAEKERQMWMVLQQWEEEEEEENNNKKKCQTGRSDVPKRVQFAYFEMEVLPGDTTLHASSPSSLATPAAPAHVLFSVDAPVRDQAREGSDVHPKEGEQSEAHTSTDSQTCVSSTAKKKVSPPLSHRPGCCVALHCRSSAWLFSPATNASLPIRTTTRHDRPGSSGRPYLLHEALCELRFILSRVESFQANRAMKRCDYVEGNADTHPHRCHSLFPFASSCWYPISTGKRVTEKKENTMRTGRVAKAPSSPSSVKDPRVVCSPMTVTLPSRLFPLLLGPSFPAVSADRVSWSSFGARWWRTPPHVWTSFLPFSFWSSSMPWRSLLSARLASWISVSPSSTSSWQRFLASSTFVFPSSLSSSLRQEALWKYTPPPWCHTLLQDYPHLTFCGAPNLSSLSGMNGEERNEKSNEMNVFWKRKNVFHSFLFCVCIWMVYRCLAGRKDWYTLAVEKEDDL